MRVDRRSVLALLAFAGLLGCEQRGPAPILGTLEWDRVAVTAELAEPVLRWDVAEGDRVEAGTALL
jgi:HlyD family secretion protein